jgi:hypothetical protein
MWSSARAGVYGSRCSWAMAGALPPAADKTKSTPCCVVDINKNHIKILIIILIIIIIIICNNNKTHYLPLITQPLERPGDLAENKLARVCHCREGAAEPLAILVDLHSCIYV